MFECQKKFHILSKMVNCLININLRCFFFQNFVVEIITIFMYKINNNVQNVNNFLLMMKNFTFWIPLRESESSSIPRYSKISTYRIKRITSTIEENVRKFHKSGKILVTLSDVGIRTYVTRGSVADRQQSHLALSAFGSCWTTGATAFLLFVLLHRWTRFHHRSNRLIRLLGVLPLQPLHHDFGNPFLEDRPIRFQLDVEMRKKMSDVINIVSSIHTFTYSFWKLNHKELISKSYFTILQIFFLIFYI